MSRRLRYIGSNSGHSGCSTLYEDEDSGNVLVQGDLVTDPDEIARMRNVKPGEGFVTVPRVLLADFAPRDVGREPVMIGYDEFESMFTTFQHTAFRLETRRQYGSDAQTETYRRFVAGEDLGWDSDDDWSRNRREQSARGKRFERVRVMDSPPTTGQRYLLANAAEIGKVGEDVRYLWREDADRLGLPAEDAWLFDSRVITLLHFDTDDTLTGIELITDPVRVARACQERDAAWHFAVPHREFGAGVPSDG
ncbi:DUF6879 family protein [Kitasatospora cineracea]|uniref:DUF6879 domain-containing protein n=1 Tax=Kitasatospora cineracea TaxID=88074 RepID=A0A8G1UII2_9ACTN|nr:DUF6879 family protein [Kitasatospora cineracea]ROR44577.1 hypothetical protein EDD39_2781 [Kitasatospora cineracea]